MKKDSEFSNLPVGTFARFKLRDDSVVIGQISGDSRRDEFERYDIRWLDGHRSTFESFKAITSILDEEETALLVLAGIGEVNGQAGI